MRIKRGNKGFSLVELIIVMAIMVALVAVIAPQYVKYVKQSHDAVLANAAEEVLSAVRTEYGVGNMTGAGDVTVKGGDDCKLSVTLGEGIEYNGANGEDFISVCGVDQGKTIKSNIIYVIKIRSVTNDVYIMKPEDASIEMEVIENGD